jgi:hypothetical protein
MTVPTTFVIGCPRSGTTFLMRALGALPTTDCLTGMLLPVAVPHVVGRGVEPEVEAALTVGFERSIDAYLHSGRFASRAAALAKWATSRGGARALLSAVRGRRRVDAFVFKEPFLSFAPGLATEGFPDARILYLTRDGRDCACSLIRTYDVLSDERLTHLRGSEMRMGRRPDPTDPRYVPWWVEDDEVSDFLVASPWLRAVWMWREMARRTEAHLTTPPMEASGRVFRVRYEDFMADPHAWGDRICAFLGVEPGRAFRKALDQAHTGSVGSHRRFAGADVEAADALAGAELRALGYDVALPPPAPSPRADSLSVAA